MTYKPSLVITQTVKQHISMFTWYLTARKQ